MKVEIVVTAGPAKGQTFSFEEPDCFLFGRTKDARVSLPDDPYVSRQHFLLEIAPPSCRVTDLESKNGTFVNGVRFGGRKPPEPGMRIAPAGVHDVRLSNSDEISVGDTRMKVIITAKTETDTATKRFGDGPGATESDSDSGATVPHDPRSGSYFAVAPEPAGSPGSAPSMGAQATIIEASGSERTVLENFEPGRSASIPAPAKSMGATINDSLCPPGEVADRLELEDIPAIPGYRIESILGQGGMGRVYKGTDLRTGQTVAIKSMIPAASVSFNNFRAFHREIEVTRQLIHPNVVQFLDVGKLKGSYYCVLEFVDGRDLKALVKSKGGSLSLAEAAPLMMGILAGLSYAHRKPVRIMGVGATGIFEGIVHRDLKPENILLSTKDSPNGALTPKIADFGLSKSYESAGMSDMTMTGTCGTPAYWPREQITHYRYLHPATDVFSIAAVFYEVLTGGPARPGLRQRLDQCRAAGRSAQISDYIKVIGENPIAPIRTFKAKFPAPVAEVLDRALRETEVPVDQAAMRQILTDLRYKDAGTFRDALEDAFKKCGIAYS